MKKKMNILLNGASSALGKNFLKYSKFKNASLYFMDRNTFQIKSLFDQENKNLIKGTNGLVFDFLINFATVYGRSNEKISDMFYCNVGLPLDIVDSIKKSPSFCLLNAGTALQEKSSAYAFSKAVLPKFFKLNFRQEIKFIEMKIQHFYGEHDREDKFFSFLFRNFKENNPFDIFTPENLREFIHTKDVVSAIDIILKNFEMFSNNEVIEIGSGKPKKIKDVVELFRRMVEGDINLVNFKKQVLTNCVNYSKSDISKLEKLGWVPQYDLIKGMDEYIKNRSKLQT